jgi:hypothetical protein
MFLAAWFRCLAPFSKGARRRHKPAARRSFIPQLDALEQRSLLSTFTVTNLLAGGTGSLRQAILSANATPGADTITFTAGLQGTITLTSGELDITDSLTITGPGAGQIAVSGNNASRVFKVAAGSTVSISGLTIENGSYWIFGDAGAGIANWGTLTLDGVTVANNYAHGGESAWGGGILNRGTLTVQNSLITNNTDATTAGGGGGGIENYGNLTVVNSTLSNNQVGGNGGAIDNEPAAVVSITGSTISGNTSNDGGGIYNYDGTVQITSSTVSGNTGGFGGGGILNSGDTSGEGVLTISDSTIAANIGYGGGGGILTGSSSQVTVSNSTIWGNANSYGGYGGGIWNTGGPLTMQNTILAGNTDANAPDLAGSLTSSGYNLVGNTQGGGGFAGTDLLNVNPLLGPLQNNGGPTQTLALLPGSPAIGAGDPSFTGPPSTDQRGLPRVVNGRLDIGAYQTQPTAASATTLSASASPAVAGQAVTFTAAVAPSPPGSSSATPTGSVTFRVDGGSPHTVTLSAGRAAFAVTLTQAGSHTVAAVYCGHGTFGGSSTSLSFTVIAAAADHLTVSAPATATAGSPFSVTVTAWDPFNNVAAGYTGTVHFTSSDKTAGLPADYPFTAADQGVHTFTGGVTLKKAASSTVTATDTGTSTITGKATLSVQAAAASHFAVTASPTSPTAGTAISVTVTALDPYGNLAVGYLGTVPFTSSDPNATLPKDYSFSAADQGKHVFSKGDILRTAGSRTVTAADTVIGSITGKATVVVKPGAATHFSVTGFPTTTAAGVAHTFVVTALDAYGNLATGYTGTVKLSSADPAAVLTPSPYTFVAGDKGKHTFTATLNTVGTWSLSAADTADATVTGSETGISVF